MAAKKTRTKSALKPAAKKAPKVAKKRGARKSGKKAARKPGAFPFAVMPASATTRRVRVSRVDVVASEPDDFDWSDNPPPGAKKKK